MRIESGDVSAGANWSGKHLFLGRTVIGRIEPAAAKGTNHIMALSYLPGAKQLIGFYADDKTAKTMVEKSADSRMRAMLDGSIKDLVDAFQFGRDLRKVGRAIYRAGIWTCDRPAYAHAMFVGLGKALEIPASEAPQPFADAKADEKGRSSAVPVPDDGELVD